MLETLILTLFSVTSACRIVAYLPQIIRAAADVNGASAISYTTWGLFVLSNISTSAYAAFVLRDTLMLVIFGGNALACLAVVAATWATRRRYAAHLAICGKPHGAAQLRLVATASTDPVRQFPERCGSARC